MSSVSSLAGLHILAEVTYVAHEQRKRARQSSAVSDTPRNHPEFTGKEGIRALQGLIRTGTILMAPEEGVRALQGLIDTGTILI
jgi:hypothetical protein